MIVIFSPNCNKSAGPNNIPLKILKLKKIYLSISEHLAHKLYLTYITNIFKTRVFPDSMKIAKVIPIHKKYSKLIVSNYQPISILSNLNEIIEKLMHNRLMKFLDNQKILYLKNNIFWKNFSSSHANYQSKW